VASRLAQVFKALADRVRLRLVFLIGAHQGGEVCVCELTTAFDLTQPTISHHLKVLREAGIIESERRGTWVLLLVRARRAGALGRTALHTREVIASPSRLRARSMTSGWWRSVP
jgi:ArsR family transcriptional regulator